jgi:PAS domain S-box-containing protein
MVFWFVGLAILTTICGALVFYFVAVNSYRDLAVDHLETTVTSRGLHVETLLRSHAQAVEYIATSIAIGRGLESMRTGENDLELITTAQERLEDFVLKNKDLVNIVVLNEQNEILMKANDSCLPKTFLIETDLFIDQVEIGSISPCADTGIFSMPFIAEMHSGAVNPGLFIFAIVNKERLFGVVGDRTGLSSSTNIYLVNQSSKYMTPIVGYESDFFEMTATSSLVADCFEEIRLSGENSLEGGSSISAVATDGTGDFSGEGTTLIGAYNVVKPIGWCLVVEIEKSSFFAIFRFYFLVAIFAGLAIALIHYVVVSRVSKSVTDPLQSLQNDLRIIESGDFSHRSRLSQRNEIGNLVKSFNHMIGVMEQSRSQVDSQVKIQTEKIIEKEQSLQQAQKAIMNVLDDVQEEKQKISLERDKIGTILFGIRDAVLVIDEHYHVTLFNSVAEKISGYTAEEVLGRSLFTVLKFITEKDGTPVEQFVRDAIERGTPSKMANHTALIRKDGARVPVADSAAPLKNKDGKIIGCVIIFRDVTHEREIERMKTEFVYVASHQLRTPLTSIKWFTELLNADTNNLRADQKEALQQVFQSNERMIHLVNELLNVSRIETGKKYTIVKAPTDLIGVINTVLTENIALIEKKKVRVERCAGTSENFTVNVDQEKIEQVFQNLINNAIKYSCEQGVIEIGCERKADELVFRVQDHGIGIPKKSQARIFEKMFRAENALIADPDGSGLGLYIARAIVEGHGGTMWFESEEGKGTTFFFTLPIGSA